MALEFMGDAATALRPRSPGRQAERPSPEGEKAADAAARLLPELAVVTSPNGSKGASHADWTPLRGRAVIIWPDADAAGLDYANAVARLVKQTGAKSVAIVSPPADASVGWDAADAEADGWTQERCARLVRSATQADAAASPSAGDGRRRTPQRDTLIGLTERCDLWHDSYRTAFVTFPVNAHRADS
jgi:hypothetical protein